MNKRDFAIYTIDADNVFFADSYSYETEGKKLDGTGVELLVCRPTNGRDAGKVHKFPLANVSRIVDRSSQ